ncbi:type VII secretion system-associated protein [Streptomyces sp. NBC_00654]|uniref:type VII secretion system-associated protein n=1 Tax=Streptomyces sp. NBC_00654 TaxID=2975799 RepID=UPI0022500528|nr:type VII secretion system-associated protein [Streptomyces sp. NBC_00654]MCX4966938.1 type VII secretion system-associated protein [Streptomyces sp. NBC_00654]
MNDIPAATGSGTGAGEDAPAPVPEEIQEAARRAPGHWQEGGGAADPASSVGPGVSGAPGEAARETGGPVRPVESAEATGGAVPRGHPAFREPPEEYVSAARLAPHHWLSVIDRHWNSADGEGAPAWAMPGRWRSDARGEIVEWQANPGYRPSPDAHGWGPPVDLADAAVRLVATGYDTEDLLAQVLADAEIAVCVNAEGAWRVTETPDGTHAVPVFTMSPRPDGERPPPHRVMPVRAFLDRLPEGREVLFLSSSAPVAQLLTAEALRTALADPLHHEAPDTGTGTGTGPRPEDLPSETGRTP